MVSDGRIVEILGENYNVDDHLDPLLERLSQGQITGFNGAVYNYDIDYNFLSSDVYKDGNKTNMRSKIVSSSELNLKIADVVTTSSDCDYITPIRIGYPASFCSGALISERIDYTYDEDGCLYFASFTYLSHTCPGGQGGGSGSGGNGSGSDSGSDSPPYGGPGGPGTPAPQTTPNPCARAKDLERTTSGFKTILDALANGTSINNFESGTYSANGVIHSSNGPAGTHSWPAPQLTNIQNKSLDFMFHNHYSDTANPSYSIFSFDDVVAFSSYVGNDKTKDPGSFIFGVTTSQGTNYVLAIENKTKFDAFYTEWIANLANRSLLNAGFYVGISGSTTIQHNEEIFLQLLADRDSGIALLKSNSNRTEWSKISRGTNSIITDTCNN